MVGLKALLDYNHKDVGVRKNFTNSQRDTNSSLVCLLVEEVYLCHVQFSTIRVAFEYLYSDQWLIARASQRRSQRLEYLQTHLIISIT